MTPAFAPRDRPAAMEYTAPVPRVGSTTKVVNRNATLIRTLSGLCPALYPNRGTCAAGIPQRGTTPLTQLRAGGHFRDLVLAQRMVTLDRSRGVRTLDNASCAGRGV